ncbi:hypothetical protein [Sinorhizobium meliloti]|uniref:hypothetical protein n=1 Tax=Rhizobium meliloti TaxID=382 RepID=UPI003F5CC284
MLDALHCSGGAEKRAAAAEAAKAGAQSTAVMITKIGRASYMDAPLVPQMEAQPPWLGG